MALYRLGCIYKIDSKGQSAVEYILLLAVVISLASFVFKTDSFKDIFGRNGRFSNVYKKELEFSYRHGFSGRKEFSVPNYRTEIHDSYNGRFFGASDAYPEQ